MATRRRPMHLDSTIIEEPFMQSIPFKNNLTIMVPSKYIYFFVASLSWTWPLLHNMGYMFNVSFSRAMISPCTRGTNLYVCSNMLAQTIGSTILVPSHTLRILSSWGSSSENIKKGTPPSLAYLCKHLTTSLFPWHLIVLLELAFVYGEFWMHMEGFKEVFQEA
jgi:hypothetical protein